MVILIDSLIKHHDHKRVLLYKNDKDAGASPSVDFVTRAFLCDPAMLVLKALRLPEFEKMNSMW